MSAAYHTALKHLYFEEATVQQQPCFKLVTLLQPRTVFLYVCACVYVCAHVCASVRLRVWACGRAFGCARERVCSIP